MNTKDKGNISELRVLTYLAESGFVVSIPYGDNCAYDLIVDNGNRLIRIQVKTGRLRNGTIVFNTSRTIRNRGNNFVVKGYENEVDTFAIYCPETGQVYFMPVDQCANSSQVLRIYTPKNGQEKNIKWAQDYFELN
jgi:hypothetical protein